MTKPRRTLLALGVAALTVAGGVAANAANAAPSSKTSTVFVDGASATPTGTGVTVNSQKTLTVSGVSGLVQFAPPCGPYCTTDYQGHLNSGTGPTLPCNPDCTLAGAPVGALLYRVGDSGPWRVLPDDGVITSRTGGEVYLIVNDDVYSDNTGGYQATLTRA